MKWLARLKNIETVPKREPTETTKRVSVVFVGAIPGHIGKTGDDFPAVNEPAPDADRWCWPNSTAMTGAEIGIFRMRLEQFTSKGLTLDDGEALADKLVKRDRESDDRHLCLECLHLAGRAAGSWRCGNWQRSGIVRQSKDAQLPGELVSKLQRCDGLTLKTKTV